MKQDEAPEVQPLGSLPRVSRLMALATRMPDLVGKDELADYAELARLANVSRARIRQIVDLLLLAPDIPESIHFLPPTEGRRAAVRQRRVRPLCATTDRRKRRRMWDEPAGSQARARPVGA